jgi:hypothetical protein
MPSVECLSSAEHKISAWEGHQMARHTMQLATASKGAVIYTSQHMLHAQRVQ